MPFQSMCRDCVNKLPNHIKFELWRPTADGFHEVLKDATLFLTNAGMQIDTINYPKVSLEDPFTNTK